MSNVVDLAAKRRARGQEASYDRAIRTGKQMAEAVKSGRVNLGGGPPASRDAGQDRERERAEVGRAVKEASARFNARHGIEDRVRAAVQSPAGVLAVEELTLQLLEQAVSALRARATLLGRA